MSQLEIQAEIDQLEDDDTDEDADTKEDGVETKPDVKLDKMRKEQAATKSKVKQSSTSDSINDEDAKCYASRYNDIDAMLDPKTHFSTVGVEQGRLGTCARRLTDYEA